MSRLALRSSAAACAFGVLLFAPTLRAAPVFLLDKTETTIFDVIPAWTQESACDCCVCWETALGTIFSYWDDVYYPDEGPWESLLLYGNRDSAPAFKTTTGAIWQLSGLGCDEGASSIPFWSSQARNAAEAYTQSLGYGFSYDVDDWVWFDTDVAAEIDADRPVYYAYSPEGNSAHAVTLVGYDAADETLYLYKNWDPVVTLKGFDEATDHRTINITPGGDATVPGAWTCAAAYHEAHDGCDCLCGSYDPDCDNAGTVYGCDDGQSCNTAGQCVGCNDDCAPPAGDRCNDAGAVVSCSDTDADGCLELGAPVTCDEGSVCQDGLCIECTCTEPDSRECLDGTHYRICNSLVPGCARWSASTPCPDGDACDAGNGTCQPVATGGAGGSAGGSAVGGSGAGVVGGSGGGQPSGGSADPPPHPVSDSDVPEESGCCTVAPGRADRAPGRALLALTVACVTFVRRRPTSRKARITS